MSLTAAQTATLKADIIAKSASGQPLEAMFAAQNWDGIADFYNALASPAFPVWQTAASVDAIFDAIEGAKYTPVDTTPTGAVSVTDGTAMTFMNRILVVQTKQMNLQNILIGRQTINAAKSNVRAWLRDAVIQLPAGASGALVSAGGASGATVLAACTRSGRVVEKLLTTGTQTTGTTAADVMGYEGTVSGRDILDTVNS